MKRHAAVTICALLAVFAISLLAPCDARAQVDRRFEAIVSEAAGRGPCWGIVQIGPWLSTARPEDVRLAETATDAELAYKAAELTTSDPPRAMAVRALDQRRRWRRTILRTAADWWNLPKEDPRRTPAAGRAALEGLACPGLGDAPVIAVLRAHLSSDLAPCDGACAARRAAAAYCDAARRVAEARGRLTRELRLKGGAADVGRRNSARRDLAEAEADVAKLRPAAPAARCR